MSEYERLEPEGLEREGPGPEGPGPEGPGPEGPGPEGLEREGPGPEGPGHGGPGPEGPGHGGPGPESPGHGRPGHRRSKHGQSEHERSEHERSEHERSEHRRPWRAPDLFAGVTTVPVVVIEDVRHALPLGRALAAGGIPCAEITLRTAAGPAAVEALAGLPGFRVGAGTVLDERQARAAVDAGADFLVSPGFDDGVWRVGLETGVPVVPGTATATEVQRAVNAGATLVKFFPAVAAGGIAALRALAEPFGSVRFMPTGGIGPDDAPAWLAEPAVLAVGGSWLAPRDLMHAGDFDEISRIARNTRNACTAGIPGAAGAAGAAGIPGTARRAAPAAGART